MLPSDKPYKILLVDDHQIMSDGLKSLLDKQPGFVVCGQVFKGDQVFPAIHALQPDLVLLDINLQGTSGIEVGCKILHDFPTVKVLVLTLYDQPKLLEETRRAGFHGYILKDSSVSDLISGIRDVQNGRHVFDKRVQQEEAYNDVFDDDFARRLNLTQREVEIIRLIRDGLTTEQIALRLFISPYTVKTHRKNIHTKLNLTNIADLVQFANKSGL